MPMDQITEEYHYGVIARALKEIDAPGGQSLSRVISLAVNQ